MNPLETETISYEVVLQEARAFVAVDLDAVHALMAEVAAQAPGRLAESLNDLLQRKGKRIRSTFLLLVASTHSGFSRERAVRACAAVELLHLASLIHDDIIDDSDVRRNEKAAHRKWGNRFAVLLGDYILAKSMEMIWGDGDHRVPMALSKASSRLIRAEVAEIDHAGRSDTTVGQYLNIIEGKTASLLEACGECAAVIAGYENSLVSGCSEIGRHFGVAFQIIDDLLDFGFGAMHLDKRKFTDLKNGLFTLPFLLFLESATAEEKAEILRLRQTAKDEAAQNRISQLLARAGAFDRARVMAADRIQACLPLLNALPQGEATKHLRRVCGLMTERTL